MDITFDKELTEDDLVNSKPIIIYLVSIAFNADIVIERFDLSGHQVIDNINVFKGWFWRNNKKEYTNNFIFEKFVSSEYSKVFADKDSAMQYVYWLLMRGFKNFVIRDLGK